MPNIMINNDLHNSINDLNENLIFNKLILRYKMKHIVRRCIYKLRSRI